MDGTETQPKSTERAAEPLLPPHHYPYLVHRDGRDVTACVVRNGREVAVVAHLFDNADQDRRHAPADWSVDGVDCADESFDDLTPAEEDAICEGYAAWLASDAVDGD